MNKWLGELPMGAVIVGVLLSVLFLLDGKRMDLKERQARADPSVLEACEDIAAHAQGAFYGTVKDRCLLKFDPRYAAARGVHTTR